MAGRQNLKSKFKIDAIHSKEPENFIGEKNLGPRIDFLEDISRRTQRSLKIFVGGVLLLLLLTLAPTSVYHGVERSKKILGAATTGFESLQAGNFENANKGFEEARRELTDSKEVLIEALNYLPLGQDLEAALGAGKHVSEGVNLLLASVKEFQDARLGWNQDSNTSSQNLYQSLKSSHEYLVKGTDELSQARNLVSSVHSSLLPEEYKTKFQKASDQLSFGQKIVQDIESLESLALGLLGGEKKIYVLIFQNNDEMRATGGFIGTYGLLQFENGTMKIVRIESIYALDGQLKEAIAAPGPLRRQETQTWALRDANWFVDFPSSSRKILEFMEKEGGILADGVISMTPNIFERLLTLTGPIEMSEYGETLNVENFREVVQYKTSLDYDRALNQPKKILADFAPKFLAKLQDLDTTKMTQVMNILSDAVREKQLMIFSLDPSLRQKIRSLELDGAIKQTDGDYLGVFHSNVGGGKTDQAISQKIEKEVSVDSGGLAIVKLKIIRTNSDTKEKFFPKNVDFMRILVPQKAVLLSASGFDNHELLKSKVEGMHTDSDLALWDQKIQYDDKAGTYVGEESGYKFLANWQELNPGQTKTVELTYEIQFASPKVYTHLLQKQSGAKAFDFTLTVKYMPGNISFYYPTSFSKAGNVLSVTDTVDTDKFYGVIGQ